MHFTTIAASLLSLASVTIAAPTSAGLIKRQSEHTLPTGPPGKPYLAGIEVYTESTAKILENGFTGWRPRLYPWDRRHAWVLADINKDFGGDYRFIQPHWTADKNEAVTSCKTWKSKTRDFRYDDVAAGAGGDFRYVLCEKIAGQNPLTKIALWRGKQPLTGKLPEDYKWATADINSGRSGNGKDSYVYLLTRN